MIDFLLATAKRLNQLPDGWQWYESERGGPWPDSNLPDETLRLVGCVPARTYTRGPRKGQPVYGEPVEGTVRAVFFTFADVRETERLWEVETGLCCRCEGTGKECVGWNAETGDKMVPCDRCKATGKMGMK